MSRLIWDQPDERTYEAGVSHGVLYPFGDIGVAWNGLVSVDETVLGGEVESLYYDGIKYLDVVANKTFQGTVKAFNAPPEFDACVGLRSVIPGFILTRQDRVQFGLSYRAETSAGYKIHLIYNALATPSNKNYQTMSDQPNPMVLEWTINAVPPESDGYKPTAHFIIDSEKVDYRTLAVLEQHLYGVPTNFPYIPKQGFIIDVIKADPEVIDGMSPIFSTPDIYDGGSPGIYAGKIFDGRDPYSHPLEEYVYV